MVLHLLKFGSTEKSKLHVLWFQSSAAHSQAGAAQSVQSLTMQLKSGEKVGIFPAFLLNPEFPGVIKLDFGV
jgi:hypothetical protein